MAKINFGGVVEDIITSDEFTLEKARQVLKNEVIAVIGYGVQGRGQALNMKDNGVHVLWAKETSTGRRLLRKALSRARRCFHQWRLQNSAQSSSTLYPMPVRRPCGRN